MGERRGVGGVTVGGRGRWACPEGVGECARPDAGCLIPRRLPSGAGAGMEDDWGQNSPTLDPRADARTESSCFFSFFSHRRAGGGEGCDRKRWCETHARDQRPPFSSPFPFSLFPPP